MSMKQKVQEIVAEALYVDAEEATPNANLMNDLGAESIDFLDIVFRLEKEFQIKIPRGEIERKAQGDLSDDEFAINGKITAAGLAQLKSALPEADNGSIKEGLNLRDIPKLFTVQTFITMVEDQLNNNVTSITAAKSASSAEPAPRTGTESRL